MKIATRNLLAELLLEAFEDRTAAMALHCLAASCPTDGPTPRTATVEQLLRPVQPLDREAVLAALQKHPLLTWSGHGQSAQWSLAPAVFDEWQAIANKLTRFSIMLREWAPNDKDTPRQQVLRKGALLFNHQLFFEVHEVLETRWMKETGDEKLFLQGLIQIAVAFYHLQNRNRHGALLLLHDGSEKLKPYRPRFLGVELSEFCRQLQEIQRQLNQGEVANALQFALEQVPRLRLVG